MRQIKLTSNSYFNWIKTSKLYNHIRSLSEGRKSRWTIYSDGRNSPYVNLLWNQLEHEFKDLFGLREISFYAHFDLDTMKPMGELTYERSTVYIHTSISIFNNYDGLIQFQINNFKFNHKISNHYYSINPPASFKNKELTKENIILIVKDYIDKNILYPKGFFRSLQTQLYVSKEILKSIYKKNLKNELEAYYEDDIRMWIARNFNVNSRAIQDLDKVIDFVNKNGKQDKMIVLSEFDWHNVYNDVEMCEGDVDEIESTFWESIEENTKKGITYIS